MTKTPNLSASRFFAPGKKRPLHQLSKLREPFISPGGTTHTTQALEKSKLTARWLVLLLLSLLMTGNYYCYDNPAALYSQLAQLFASTPHFDLWFDGLYSVYSLPNIVLPLIGGMIVDRAGVVFSLNLFTLLILCGQVVTAAACGAGSLRGMLLGRAIFGLGGESLSVAQSAFVTRWFQSKELALALGLTLSVARFGSVLNNAASPWIAAEDPAGVPAALWAGAAVCVLSMLCSVGLGAIDAHYTRRIAERFRIEDDDANGGDGPVLWKDLTRFGRPFWKLACCCLVVYGCVLPFNNVASALLQERDFFPPGSLWPGADASHPHTPWRYDPLRGASHPPDARCSHRHGAGLAAFCAAQAQALATSSEVMSEPYVISALLTPLLGWAVDRYGGRATLCVASALCVTLVHLALGLTALPAALLLLGLGLGYSVFASVIWPSVAYVVDSRALGTAYGVVTSLQNLGLCLIPLAVGAVHEATRGWHGSTGASVAAMPLNSWSGVELFFAALGGLGIAAGLSLCCDPLVRMALNSPTGRLPDGHRIFVQDGWQLSPASSRPSPLVAPSAGGKKRGPSPPPLSLGVRGL